MNIEKLMDMQSKLDNHIETKHGLQGEDLVAPKVLALLVELGELANETRSFKFWSTKGPSAKEVILTEYVDGIHFILSLALEKGFKLQMPNPLKEKEISVTEQFLVIYRAITDFQSCLEFDSFQTVFAEYIYLGTLLGFTLEEVEQSYISKNEVNHERQRQGY